MSLRNFKYIALAEATTFLLLLIASVVKRASDEPLGVEILGPIHGLLFIAYFVMALSIREGVGWSGKQTLLILLGAVLPFGGYVVDGWINRNNAEQLRAEAAGRA
jgi:integral membrane protein